MVLLFAYNFNEKTSFVTEVELEHVKEVFKINDVSDTPLVHVIISRLKLFLMNLFFSMIFDFSAAVLNFIATFR